MVNDEVTKVRVSGDGSTDTVDFDFKYLQDSDIKVYKIDTSVTPEVATLQVLNTDYTVTAADPQGGTITFTTAPLATEDAFVKLDAPYTQTVDIPSAGVFREEAIEILGDKPVILCQQLREEISRAIQLPETSSIASVSFDTPVDGRALKWRDDGSGNWTAESSSSDPDDAATYAAAALASANAAAQDASDADTARIAAEAAQAAAEAASGLFTLASQAEAEAGADNTKYMSALRVAQAIDAQVVAPDKTSVFGSISNPSWDTVYLADADGILIATDETGTTGAITFYMEAGVNPPTVIVAQTGMTSSEGTETLTCFIKKGLYWKVTGNNQTVPLQLAKFG